MKEISFLTDAVAFKDDSIVPGKKAKIRHVNCADAGDLSAFTLGGKPSVSILYVVVVKLCDDIFSFTLGSDFFRSLEGLYC